VVVAARRRNVPGTLPAYSPGMRVGHATARRLRLASLPAVAIIAVLMLALTVAGWPLAALARQSVNNAGGGLPWWFAAPFGLVGLVVAWRRPGNRLGWCLVGLMLAGALNKDGSFYAIADYRLRHGTLPLGWVAMLAQPGWSIAIVLLGLIVLIFPDGTLPSPRLRWVLWLYLALGLVWMVTAYWLTVGAIVRHGIRVDSDGNLLALDNSAASPGWWNVLQDVLFVVLALSMLLSLAAQVASYRRSSGERRQQLKWLLGGFAAALAGAVLAIALRQAPASWQVVAHFAVLAIFAVPVSMGVAILRYRLYDIDRIISKTLAYAIITGLLVGVYVGLVLLATGVFRFHGTVAVAASTLVAAALFAPVRGRVQRLVDRRFNRARYDAERTVAAFTARLKDAVDLDTVREDLAGVVQAALEPAHIAVWTTTWPGGITQAAYDRHPLAKPVTTGQPGDSSNAYLAMADLPGPLFQRQRVALTD
jgi:hypothetical protein